jgi:hypothetical protein
MRAPALVRLVAPALVGALALGPLAAGPAPAAPPDSARRATNPTGVAAGSRPNGADYLGLSLQNTAQGLRVSWARPPGKVKGYIVRVGINRLLDARVRTYRVGARRRAVVVPHSYGATSASGNYSFVKLQVAWRNRRGLGASPTKWIQAPLGATCPAGRTQVRIGTFNIRGWQQDVGRTHFDWNARKARVVSTILSSGARALSIQEASGRVRRLAQYGPDDQWRMLIRLLNAAPGSSGQWRDAYGAEYSRNGGRIGTRVIYDGAVYEAVPDGSGRSYGVATVSGAIITWIPWVHLRHKETGGRFYLVAAHLDDKNTVAAYTMRGRQTDQLISLVRTLHRNGGSREQVFLAGDFNSTGNTKPDNNVQVKLMQAGFYDSFATTRISRPQYGTTNNFSFPVRATPSRRDYIMSYGPLKGSCAYWNLAYTRAAEVASDHFMQAASLPIGP